MPARKLCLGEKEESVEARRNFAPAIVQTTISTAKHYKSDGSNSVILFCGKYSIETLFLRIFMNGLDLMLMETVK